jgi:hypothetical protein
VRAVKSGRLYRVTEVLHDGLCGPVCAYGVDDLESGLPNALDRSEVETVAVGAARRILR